jgi:hypothetical protein
VLGVIPVIRSKIADLQPEAVLLISQYGSAELAQQLMSSE